MKSSNPARRFVVAKDGKGIASHAGSAALAELADAVGLTQGLSWALAGTRRRNSGHDRGRVLRDLVVMLADGGDCLSDLRVLRDQPQLFEEVASTSTAMRVVASIGPQQLEGIRRARSAVRERAWKLGARPKEIVIDIDATLVTAHSEKELAAGNYKKGFGFHPLMGYLDGCQPQALAGLLRPGNAGSNTADDHIEVLEMAIAQLPDSAITEDVKILVRTDSGGATHDFVNALRGKKINFSIGFDLTEPVREAILATPDTAWVEAITQADEVREGAAVCELDTLDLSAWPKGTRAICRRERPHPGAQLTFTDINGYRFQVFITDQNDYDLARLELRHRSHARVEDRIRCGKDTGLANLPFRNFDDNQAWLELVLAAQDLIAFFQALCLDGQAACWEPKKLRYRLFHTAARVVRSGRRIIVRLQQNWPWSGLLHSAFDRLYALQLGT
jgi:hypothetical protein